MNLVEVIGLVSGLLAIGGATYAGYRRFLLPYVRKQVFRPLDPAEPVDRDALRFTDVAQGIEILEKKVSAKSPDVVLAVDRGGAIVGGLLAKALTIPIRTLSRVDRENRFQSDFPPSDLDRKTVLLVDDASRTGSTLRSAVEYVREHFSAGDVIVAVLLVTEARWRGHEAQSPAKIVDYFAYRTSRVDVDLPWDVD